MNPINILLMEDDHIISQDIITTLNNDGYAVVTGYPEIFKAGAEFPDNIDRMIVNSEIGLVLMDINLNSQLDGVDIVKHIHRKSDVPVIYISGTSNAETVLRAKETEPHAYLLKPFSPEQLKSQIELTLQHYQLAKERRLDLADKTGIWYVTVAESVVKTSFSWLKHLGLDADMIRSESDFLAIVHPDDVENVKTSVNNLKKRLVTKRAFEYRIVDRCGNALWILSKIIDARENSTGEFLYTILSLDITQQKRPEEASILDAARDSLTGLLNRRVFMEELDKLLRETDVLQKNFALIFSGLDNLKQINDAYGHATGDQLLRKVSECLKQVIKKKDLMARLGDAEFAFIVRDIKKSADMHDTAQRMVNSLQKSFKIGNLELRMNISLGIAMPEAVSGTAESLLNKAETAMQQAKKDKQVRYKIFRHSLT